MSGWAPRRFWRSATVAPAADGYAVLLDGRPVRTPAKAPFIVPTAAMAGAAAAEWDAQGDTVNPNTMPVTRAVNAAIDKVAPDPADLVEGLLAYAETDLLCYRAPGPAALAARQAAAWDPLLAWASEALQAPMRVTVGVQFCAQPPDSLGRLRARITAYDPFRLTALSDLVSLPGSLVIGLAVATGRIDPDTAWEAAHVDERWQADQWGVDAEAAAAEAHRHEAFRAASRFLDLCV
jgi:chaperone required for assembly of F1-ATPase